MASPEPTTHEPAPKKSRNWGVILAIVCAVALVGVIGLGVLAAIVVPNLLDRFGVAQRKRAEIDIAVIEAALADYARKNGGEYPMTLEVLVIPDANGSFYLNGNSELPLDPWGVPYEYVPGGGEIRPRIVSFGRDGFPGGSGADADIDSREIFAR